MSKSPASGLWRWSLTAALLAMGVGFLYFSGKPMLSIAVGCFTGLLLTFMLERMASRAVLFSSPGKALIFGIFLKSLLRFLLTGLFLAILFYLGWITPLGFVIGFTSVIGSVFAWGCSRLFIKGN